MKLDPSALRFLSDDDFRVLTAVEMGMKNHDIVPTQLIGSLSGLKLGGVGRGIRELHKHKLLHHECQQYDGYRLTSMGYDFLALRALSKRGVITNVGKSLGVGKEADVFVVTSEDGDVYAMKVHRLGRTSFRAVKEKRDYLRHRKSASWMYLSRLAAMREWSFLRALHEHDFPVPTPIDWNRHIVVMSLVDAFPLTQVKELGHPVRVCNELLGLCHRLGQHGLIHGDLNEFNILIDDDEQVTMIDFPQVVSTSHQNADELFARDVNGLRNFFTSRFGVDSDDLIEPSMVFDAAEESGVRKALDVKLEASGFTKEQEKHVCAALEAARTDVCQEDESHGDPSFDEEVEEEPEREAEGEAEEIAGEGAEEGGVEEVKEKANTKEMPVRQRAVGNFSPNDVALIVRRQRQKQSRKAASSRNNAKDKTMRGLRSEAASGSNSFWG